ncbi:MAG: RHS repeat-associated core domain-containing protein [Sphingomonadales bacterium]|nr:RHS repeat-associated core domain-containing protein [Sphingomonadales bacterium]
MNIIGRSTSDTLKSLHFNTMTLEQAYPDGGGALGEEMPQIGEDPGGYPGQARILYWYHPDYIQNVDLVTDLDGEAYELFLYNPWGEQLHHWSSNSSAWTSPYRFNAKEVDPESGLAYYGARYYQSKLGVWLSVDPMAMSGSNMSRTSYSFTNNNPIMMVDPDGRNSSPIYDLNGEFLGTDGQGLKGKAIIMQKSDFTQGMAHSDALSKDIGTGGLLYNNDGVFESGAKGIADAQRFNEHYAGLSSRPDYDGFVTIDEGVQWAKDHPKTLPDNVTADNSLYMDASQLDFGNLSTNNMPLKEGEKGNVNLLNYTSYSRSRSRATTYALGNTMVEYLNADNGTVRLFWDNYDWDYHNNPPSGSRDRAVQADRLLKGLNDSHGFKVYIYGKGTIAH